MAELTKPKMSYKPKNKAEQYARKRVWDRYTDIKSSQIRIEAEESWENADKDHRLYIAPKEDGDWRARLHLPDSFAGIQAYAQESIERYSRPWLDPVEYTDQAREMLGNAILTWNMDTTKYDYQTFIAKEAAAIRGTGIVMEEYVIEKRVVKYPTGLDEEGNLTYTEREIIDVDDSVTRFIENEFIYIDERATHIDYAIDIIYREIIPREEFLRVYGMRKDFMNIDKVGSSGNTSENSNFFKHASDLDDDSVEILHYHNRATDSYDALANNILIRMGPLPTPHKELPIAVYTFYHVPGRIYGMGIPEVIKSLTSERSAMRNTSIDRVNMDLNQMFITNSLLDLDEEDLVTRPYGLIEVESNGLPLDQVIQPLKHGQTPASYYRMDDIVLEDIRRATGIDDRITGVSVGGTAFEAALLKEQAQKRINLINRLAEMDTVLRIGKLKWSNIRFYYPIPKIERIVEDNGVSERKTYKKIRVSGKEFEIQDIPEKGGKELRVRDMEGYSIFELNKTFAAFIDGEVDIIVKASATTQLSKPLKQAKNIELVNVLTGNPLLMSTLDPKKVSRRTLQIQDEDPEDWMASAEKSDAEWIALAEHENMLMFEGNDLPPTPDAPELHSLIHLSFTESVDYERLPDKIKKIFEEHITGEYEQNPNTGGLDELDTGVPKQPGQPGQQGQNGQPAGGAGPSIPPVDLQPSSVQGETGEADGNGELAIQ